MPNWCENQATIQVPERLIAEALSCVLDDNKQVYEDYRKDIPEGRGLPFWGEQPLGLLGFFFPEPDYDGGDKELANDSVHHTFPDWYSWRVNNWGTKWEVDVEHYTREDNDDGSSTFFLYFDSAWSPPLGVYDAIHAKSNQGYSIYAIYIEGGMGYCGEYENGSDNSYELGTRDTTDVPKHLQEEFAWHYDYMEECEEEEAVNG
tara:strand:+ start:84 stop:695 length:612 start_codon:yes stop_codon:yes gene_type:complete